MDLIYADRNGKELGILKEYELDLAYGSSENNFSLVLNLEDHCLEENDRIAAIRNKDGKELPTEYGGIIDAIEVDTDTNEVTYTGRTWQGVLEKKIVDRDDEASYLLFNGEANECLNQLIDLLGMKDLFDVEPADSGIQIESYEMTKYIGAYTGVVGMLADADAKLQIRYRNKKVYLGAVLSKDYSDDEAYNDTDMVVKRIYNDINHLICVGYGDNEERYVIHLYTDVNGGLKPYYDGENAPLQDSDYILDRREQVLFGSEEITEVRTFSSVQTVNNYIALEVQPSDWNKTYSDYYTYDEETERYDPAEAEEEDVMTLLTAEPSDWSSNYSDYYQKKTVSGKTSYSTVESKTNITYSKLTKKPKNWKKHYKEYYEKVSDSGTGWSYKQVESKKVKRYKAHTEKPTEWSTDYTRYYKRKKEGGYEKLTQPANKKIPKWKKGKYYTQVTVEKTPDFPGTVYRKKTTKTAPDYVNNTYYKKTQKIRIPAYAEGAYYEKVLDHYANMVSDGVEYLENNMKNRDEIQMNLDNETEYDIGDYVGATEKMTGIGVIQPITKKIVKINGTSEDVTVDYEIGNKE